MGIWYGYQLKQIDRLELKRMFGKAGSYYYNICRGVDNREVQPSRERKSLGAENTFSTDLFKPKELEEALKKIADKVWYKAEQAKLKAKTLTLKFKYADFEQHTRSKTLENYYHNKNLFLKESYQLMQIEGGFQKGIRLLGLTLSNFVDETDKKRDVQLVLKFE